MNLKNKYLGIIPARSGSKGIENKNICLLNGKPLIEYTINAGLNSCLKENIVVSTDSEEIANISRKLGVDVPFLRPKELSTDSSSSIDLILHCLDKMIDYENIILLQPTSPLRNHEHINEAIHQFEISECNSLISTQKQTFNRDYFFNYKNDKIELSNSITHQRRQDANLKMVPNGAIYISSQKNIRENKTFFTSNTKFYEMNKISSIDIDDIEDLKICESLLLNDA